MVLRGEYFAKPMNTAFGISLQQQKIANILDAADALRQNDKALIAKYDELTQALFLDMFGDPVANPMGWEKVPFGNFITALVATCTSPSGILSISCSIIDMDSHISRILTWYLAKLSPSVFNASLKVTLS